ncbi:hypothetical protein [Plasticicumulans acidivorans]|uniref:hypothetical protein n=1 Tax=Plasticicumulans acidivorans TaxID=886464 RepID=UPI0011B80475|nr:hypothetical protein [Plasticicumulans acidivorans]
MKVNIAHDDEQAHASDFDLIIKDTIQWIRHLHSNNRIVTMLEKQGINKDDALVLISTLRAEMSKSINSIGYKNTAFGFLWFFVGSFITLLGYSAMSHNGGGRFTLFWGAILYGGIKFIFGVSQLIHARLIRN